MIHLVSWKEKLKEKAKTGNNTQTINVHNSTIYIIHKMLIEIRPFNSKSLYDIENYDSSMSQDII